MSTWASRLSQNKPTFNAPAHTERVLDDATRVMPVRPAPLPVIVDRITGAVEEPRNSGLREEFRSVAELFNRQSVCLLSLPLDCWDMTAQYLSYMDVVALCHTCRSLWTVLHSRDSIWWRQLAYFHADMRDMRGGKLLCTAPLFPSSQCGLSLTDTTSSATLPTAFTSPATGCSEESELRGPRQRYMPAYERFFQERRLYVLDSHREWHFQELADFEDKDTGMFTVVLHDGRTGSAASGLSGPSPLSVDAVNFDGAPSPPPLLPRVTAVSVTSAAGSPVQGDRSVSAREWLLSAPTPPESPVPAPGPSHQRGLSALTEGTSAGNSPSLTPAAAPPTPPLLPRVGEPIINARNPPLQLRVYAICSLNDANADQSAGSTTDNVLPTVVSSLPASTPTPAVPASLSGMTEEQIVEYVMRLSMSHVREPTGSHSPYPPSPLSPPIAKQVPDSWTSPATFYRQRIFRPATSDASLPLSKLLVIIDAFNNNAFEQLNRYNVQDYTEDEDPDFLNRLAETLRSAKHRRLFLGNHHRAVRNNGQTTRNREGRAAGSSSINTSSVYLPSASTGAPATPPHSPPPPASPPPMNRMLRMFHGQLLEITEREAQVVAAVSLGLPNVIDDFVVFRCYDPVPLYQALRPCGCIGDMVSSAIPSPTVTPVGMGVETGQQHCEGSRVSGGASVNGRSAEKMYGSAATIDSGSPSASRGPRQTTSQNGSLSHQLNCPAVKDVVQSLKPLPFYTRFFLAPELCQDGYIALIVVDVVRVLVIVEEEVVSVDDPAWASTLNGSCNRLVLPGQGYNPQSHIRDEYNYVPANPIRRPRDPDSEG